MMYFNNSEIQIYRRRKKGNTDRYAMSATFTAFSGDIQPASQERVEFVSGRIGAVFTGFVDTTVDIKEGDQISVSGKRYSVKGVQIWSGAGLLDHKELLLTSQDA